MSKIAFLYPGQGAQYVGMGKDLYESYSDFREVVDEAEDVLNFNIKDICFFGPKEKLQSTEITQPAVLINSMAITKILRKEGIVPEATAGLSLGEYSAFTAARVMEFKDAVKIVKKRGEFMQEAVPAGAGAMAAVLGLKDEVVDNICKEISDKGCMVIPANYNCPGQIVISGDSKAVEMAIANIKNAGGKAIKLSVSGPFHSPLLRNASIRLSEELIKYKFNEPKIPMVLNATGKIYDGKSDIKEIMKEQVISPVLWSKTIATLIDMEIDTFLEIGPGKALSGFIKKINPQCKVLNIENISTLNKAMEAFK